MNKSIFGATCACLAVISFNATAMVFEESSSFDLNGDQRTPTLLGALDSGINNILGTHTRSESGIGQGDTFSVIPPSTYEIIRQELIISICRMWQI